jgi:hypothetical protein
VYSDTLPSAAPVTAAPAEAAALPTAPAPRTKCPKGQTQDIKNPNSCQVELNLYERFLSVSSHRALTPGEKAKLAFLNLTDPYNAATILLSSAYSVASDPYSPYGPGMNGYGRSVGVAYTEDLTGEFFSTFLIPSIARQDPHYHRMPNAGIPRRVLHTIIQPMWTQSDKGTGMPNYAFIVGSLVENEIANLYVPGRETNGSATASRYFEGYYLAPIDNLITEFLPDVARKIHVRIFLVQHYIDRASSTP